MKKTLFRKNLEESILVKRTLISQYKNIELSINKISECIKNNKKVFLCGNGGSAADAQHLTAEMLVRLRPKIKRRAIPFLNLAMDTSTITACGNDFNFNYIFSRPFEALSSLGDIIIAISTSGNSKNILEVLKIAKKKKIFSIGFFGKTGGKAKKYCDLPILVNSKKVARIQEAHIFLGHYILEQFEINFLKKTNIKKINEN